MTDRGVWGRETSPYHRGERALYERYGRKEEQTAMARHIHAPALEVDQVYGNCPKYNETRAFTPAGKGVLFVDFASGDVLQLTGAAEIFWEDDPAIVDFLGAKRGWRFILDDGSLLRAATNGGWEFGAYSQTSLRTGTWAEVQ